MSDTWLWLLFSAPWLDNGFQGSHVTSLSLPRDPVTRNHAGQTEQARTLCYSVPGALSSAPTWHTGALESVPLNGIVRRRDFIHAGHDSDRR